jgi:hypothetical protein
MSKRSGFIQALDAVGRLIVALSILIAALAMTAFAYHYWLVTYYWQ